MSSESIVFLSLLVAVLGGWIYWTQVVVPRRKKTHLRQVARLISEWYQHIELNFNRGLDKKYLNEMEGKILKFIEGSELKTVRMNFSPSFRVKYLTSRGVAKDVQISEYSFQKHSGIDSKSIDLHTFWLQLRRSFYQFYWNYTGEDLEKYFDSLEARVSLFKLYFE